MWGGGREVGGEVFNTEVMNRGRQNDGPHQGENIYVVCECMCYSTSKYVCVRV